MWITDKNFWLDTAERCLGTFCEVLIPILPVSGTPVVDFKTGAYIVIGSTLACFCKCVVFVCLKSKTEKLTKGNE